MIVTPANPAAQVQAPFPMCLFAAPCAYEFDTLIVYVDPRGAQLLASASDADFFAIDPRGAAVIG